MSFFSNNTFKLGIFFILVLACEEVKAQRYLPIIDGSKEWSLINCPSVCRMDYYWTAGDTVLGGTNYTILDGFHFVKTVVMREDTVKQQVFLKAIGMSSLSPEVLTYDFSLSVGDSMEIKNVQAPIGFNSGFFTVDSIKRIDYLGTKRKTMYLSGNDTSKGTENQAIWVEGIGSLSLINTPGSAPDVPGIGAINCVFKNGELIYRDNYNQDDSCTSYYVPTPKDTSDTSKNDTIIDFSLEYVNTESLQLFPNPAREFVQIKTGTAGNFQIVSLSGEVIRNQSVKVGLNEIQCTEIEPGVYIFRCYMDNEKAFPVQGKLVITR